MEICARELGYRGEPSESSTNVDLRAGKIMHNTSRGDGGEQDRGGWVLRGALGAVINLQ